MPKPKSRSQRWNEALSAAWDAKHALESAIGALEAIQQEYIEWRDNLPENLENSSLGEKLAEICDLDLDPANVLDAVDDTLTSAELATPPRGFGRD
jgi:hypothetical protein